MILHLGHLSQGSSSEIQDATEQIHPTGSNSSDGYLPLHTVSNKPDCSRYISLRLESTHWEQLETS